MKSWGCDITFKAEDTTHRRTYKGCQCCGGTHAHKAEGGDGTRLWICANCDEVTERHVRRSAKAIALDNLMAKLLKGAA